MTPEAQDMKVFIVACISALIIATIAGFVLNIIQEPVDKAFTSSAVRLGT